MTLVIDLTGQQFGMLTVLSHAGHGAWNCRCECGTEKAIWGHDLRRGKSSSCGCRRGGLTHGTSRCGDPIYQTWHGMCARVRRTGSRYARWRRLGMFPDWQQFEQFRDYVLANLGPRPGNEYSLDRIDNDIGYYPGNIRWATAQQQAQNRSTTRRSST